MATCSLPSRLFQKATIRNRPNRLGKSATASTRTQTRAEPKPAQSWVLSRSTRSSRVATGWIPLQGGSWAMDAFLSRSGLNLRREQVDLFDLRRLRKEVAGARHQRFRDRTFEVRLATALVGERIEDAELILAELEREPDRRPGFCLRQRQRAGEKLLEFGFLARLRVQTDEQRDFCHGFLAAPRVGRSGNDVASA